MGSRLLAVQQILCARFFRVCWQIEATITLAPFVKDNSRGTEMKKYLIAAAMLAMLAYQQARNLPLSNSE